MCKLCPHSIHANPKQVLHQVCVCVCLHTAGNVTKLRKKLTYFELATEGHYCPTMQCKKEQEELLSASPVSQDFVKYSRPATHCVVGGKMCVHELSQWKRPGEEASVDGGGGQKTGLLPRRPDLVSWITCNLSPNHDILF